VATGSDLPPYWLLLVYRVPSEPSRHRVAIWREMKRMGALYVQNCVCLLPGFRGVRKKLQDVAQRVEGMSGSSLTFEIRKIAEPELTEVITGFRQQSEREYDEIIEECETKFRKEIEFERFRQNFTFEEAEEIWSDLEKIKAWLARVVERDWLGSERRSEAEGHVAESEEAFEAFERECFAASQQQDAPLPTPGGELLRTATLGKQAVRRRPRRGARTPHRPRPAEPTA
jgi:hypothetical protein